MAKQISEQGKLLQKRKKATKGKRVRLEGITIYITTDILRVAREEEARIKIKKLRGRLRKVIIVKSSTKEEDEVSKDLLDSLDKELVVRTRRVVFSYIKV